MFHIFDFIIGKMIDDLYFVIGEVIDDLPQSRFVCEVCDFFDFNIGKVVHNFDFHIREIVHELDFTKEFTFVGNPFCDGVLAECQINLELFLLRF